MRSNTLDGIPIRLPSPTTVSFPSRKRKSHSPPGKKARRAQAQITLEHTEFIRRYLMHVLPSGFRERFLLFVLNNRMKRKNLKLIFTLQGHQRFKRRFTEMSMSELLKAVWDFDISICPDCGHSSMKQLGRCYAPSWLSWLLILFWKSLPTGGFESMSCNVLHHKISVFSADFSSSSIDFGHLGTIQSPYKNC